MQDLSSFAQEGGIHRSVAFGGYEFQRRPVALARRVARGQLDPEALIAAFGGIETDIAVRNPSVQELSYGTLTLGVYGLAPAATARVTAGQVRTHEYGATSILRSLQAGARELHHMPSYAVPPSARNHDGRIIGNLAALRPKLGLLHVPYADPVTGYAWGYGIGPDLLLAAACEQVVVSYDIAVATPPMVPGAFVIPPNMVAGLIHQPLGAFPSGAYPLYPPYAPFYETYFRAESHRTSRTSPVVEADDRSFLKRFLQLDDLRLLLPATNNVAVEIRKHRKDLSAWIQT